MIRKDIIPGIMSLAYIFPQYPVVAEVKARNTEKIVHIEQLVRFINHKIHRAIKVHYIHGRKIIHFYTIKDKRGNPKGTIVFPEYISIDDLTKEVYYLEYHNKKVCIRVDASQVYDKIKKLELT